MHFEEVPFQDIRRDGQRLPVRLSEVEDAQRSGAGGCHGEGARVKAIVGHEPRRRRRR